MTDPSTTLQTYLDAFKGKKRVEIMPEHVQQAIERILELEDALEPFAEEWDKHLDRGSIWSPSFLESLRNAASARKGADHD